MNELRVLMITTTYLGFNGITSVIMNYYNNIDRSKIQFDFAVGLGIHESVKKEIEELGGIVYELPSRKKNTLKYIKELRILIKKNKYNVVHAHGNSGTLYLEIHTANLAGAQIRIAHSHNSTCNHKIIHRLLKGQLNREITNAIACSKMAGDWLYNKEYMVCNNGIDIEKFLYNKLIRNKYREELGLKDKFVLGHIGHFSFQKNHEFLLDTFSEINKINPNCKLLIIGDGKLKRDIEKKIFDLRLEDSILCLGKRKDVAELIQAMDVFVLPSRFEGLPVVLIEAQASGLHCVVADTITSESQITDKVDFIQLDMGAEYWAEQVLNYNKEYQRDNVFNIVKNSNYNIKNETKKLECFYLNNAFNRG